MTNSPANTKRDASAEEAASAAVPKPALVQFLIGMLIVTGIAVGAGGLLGLHISGKIEQAAAHKANTPAGQAFKGRFAETAVLKPLPAIVTNLSSPERTWIRMEAAIVLDGEPAGDGNALVAQIAEDFVAFLRTVPLAQIEGPSGFQNLREDLYDRVRIRSGGKVRELVIQTFIVE